MRFLHLADLHLGWSPVFLADRETERRRERDGLLARAVDYALDRENKIGLVLIAGDLFETHRPEKELVEKVLQELHRLVAGGIQLVLLPGNHDEITYHNSVYQEQVDRWPGILVRNPRPALVAKIDVQGERCYVYSLAYTGGITPTATPLADFPRMDAVGWHIGMFHGSLDWNAGDRSLPLASSGLARAGYHYVALGHLHSHKVVQLSSGPAVYAGAVEAKGFNDPGEGFFTVVTLSPEGAFLEKIDAGSRRALVRTLDAGLYATPAELEEQIKSLADPQSMVRLILKGVAGFPLEVSGLRERNSRYFYYLEIEDQMT
ncbi:MAG: metallophosphoesterase family protein, partial [Bacillota bacterium]